PPRWWAYVVFRGARVQVDGHADPHGAALALSIRILRGAVCKCGRSIAIADGLAGSCRWRLVGNRWEPGCEAPPIKVQAPRGDHAAMREAFRRAHGKDPHDGR